MYVMFSFPLQVKDLFPYSIALPFDQLENQELMLFPKGSLFPNTRLIKHNEGTSFNFQVLYTNLKDLPSGVSPLVGHFKVRMSLVCSHICYNTHLIHFGPLLPGVYCYYFRSVRMKPLLQKR